LTWPNGQSRYGTTIGARAPGGYSNAKSRYGTCPEANLPAFSR